MVRQGKVFQDNRKDGSNDQTGKRTDRWFDRSQYVDATASKWWNRYQAQGNVDDLPRSGRPRVTSAAEESEQVHKA